MKGCINKYDDVANEFSRIIIAQTDMTNKFINNQDTVPIEGRDKKQI